MASKRAKETVPKKSVSQRKGRTSDTARTRRKRAVSTDVFQMKIVLLGAEPPIWRRIMVQDCTLDELHEYIQSAMGWENYHLHNFDIDGVRYGNPEMLDGGFGEFDGEDSRKVTLGAVLADQRKGFHFRYTYDFGDNWEHAVILEGRSVADPGLKYPRCTDGARACPPEDCGGPWGYEELLEALRDPKHPEHDGMLDWAGEIDAEEFSTSEATKAMRR